MAYELVCELLRRDVAPPALLLVSGQRAPHQSDPKAFDADRQHPRLHTLQPSEAFWQGYTGRYALSKALSDAAIRATVEPTLRAAFKLNETYKPTRTPADPPLPCRLMACQSAGDQRLQPGQICEWRKYANPDVDHAYAERQFTTHVPDASTPHDYVADDPSQLLATLSEESKLVLSGKQLVVDGAPGSGVGSATAAPVADPTRGRSLALPGAGLSIFEVEEALHRVAPPSLNLVAFAATTAPGTASEAGTFEVCVAVVSDVLGGGCTTSIDDVRTWARKAQLPRLWLPTRLVSVEEIPRDAKGQVDRRRLVARASAP